MRSLKFLTLLGLLTASCFPPAHASWSATLYGLPENMLVENPMNRYLFNPPMLPDLKRDIEIFLAAHDSETGKLVAACYNTLFTSEGIPTSRDTAPQDLVKGLDFDQMKTEYGVVGASLNGPKIWLPD